MKRLALGIAALCAAFFMPAAHAAVMPNSIPGISPAQSGDVLLCSGHPWIDVRCNGALGDDSHDDTSAISDTINQASAAGGAPIRFSTGTYKVTLPIVIDSTGLGHPIKIISDGAAIDGATSPVGPVLMLQRSGGTPASPALDRGSAIQGTLTVNCNVGAYCAQIGKNDFSDKFERFDTGNLIVHNVSASTSAGGLKLNFVTASRIAVHATTAGGGASVAGLTLEQVQNSSIRGAAGAAGGSAPSLLMETGASIGNTFAALDYVSTSPACLTISSATAANNTFVSPVWNCPVAIAQAAGSGNNVIGPTYGSNTTPGPSSGGINIIGRGSLSHFAAPEASSRTLYGIDDGLVLSSANAIGPSTVWTAQSLPVTLPDPATVGDGWTAGFVTDGGRAVVISPASGFLYVGPQALTSLTLGPGNGETAQFKALGGKMWLVQGSTRSLIAAGAAPPGVPSRWITPGGSGYTATQADNGNVISSFGTGSGLALTLPAPSSLTAGWTIGLAADGQPLTIATNGGSLYLPTGSAAVTPYSLPAGVRFQSYLQFDGTNFRLLWLTPSAIHMPTNAALIAQTAPAGFLLYRDGVNAPGDAGGSLAFMATGAQCTVGSGSPKNGDIGYQVKLADGNCAQAIYGALGVDPRQFGGAGDDNTDIGAIVQTIINDMPAPVTINEPAGIWRWRTGVTAAVCFNLDGIGWNENQGNNGQNGVVGTLTGAVGSWNHLSDTAVFPITVTGAAASGHCGLRRTAWFEDHPAPTGGWSPSGYKPIVTLSSSNGGGAWDLEDFYCENCPRWLNASGWGRLNLLGKIQGQLMGPALEVESSADDLHVEGIFHAWPYWTADSNVRAYGNAHGIGLLIHDADHPKIGKFFVRNAYAAIEIEPITGGAANQLSASLIDCDGCQSGVHVTGTAGQASSGMIDQINFSGGDGNGNFLAGSNAIRDDSAGGNGKWTVSALHNFGSGGPIVDITNATNSSRWLVAAVLNEGYNHDNNGSPAFFANPLSAARIAVQQWSGGGAVNNGGAVFTPALNTNDNPADYTVVYDIPGVRQNCNIGLGFGNNSNPQPLTGQAYAATWPRCVWSVDGKGGMHIDYQIALQTLSTVALPSPSLNAYLTGLPYLCASPNGSAGGGRVNFYTGLSTSPVAPRTGLGVTVDQTYQVASLRSDGATAAGTAGGQTLLNTSDFTNSSRVYGEIDCPIR